MSKRPSGNPNGRPKIKIDTTQFESLCNLQCTKEEIAGFFKCSEDTIENFCHREYQDTFSATYKKYSQNGKISLRREQFKLAQKGNSSMLIWLGKQYLGQKEQIDTNVSGNGMLEGILEYMKNNERK